MKRPLAALLLSTALFACSKAPDAGPSAAPVPADPAPVATNAPAAAAPAPDPGAAPAAAAPAPAPSAAAPADTAAPDLVEAAPGVQVVADYDAPVFYTSGMYWRHNDNGWYSSSEYTGGWAYRASPPSVVVNIDHPERFVHYKPSGYVAVRRPLPQREWHPEPVRADVRVDPRAEVHVDPHAEVRVDPHAEVRVDSRTDVRVDPRAEVRVAKPVVVGRDHR